MNAFENLAPKLWMRGACKGGEAGELNGKIREGYR